MRKAALTRGERPKESALVSDESEDAAVYLRRLPRNMVQNTMTILDHEDAVRKVDPDHFEVLSLRTPSRRVRVYRRDDLWRCRVDKENNQDRPCSHILAVLIYEGLVDLPNTAATVWTKGKDGRKQTLEAQAWRLVPTKLPDLLARLLREGLSVAAPSQPVQFGRASRSIPRFTRRSCASRSAKASIRAKTRWPRWTTARTTPTAPAVSSR